MGLNIASETTQARIAAALEAIARRQIEPASGEFDPAAAQRLVRYGMGPSAYPVGTAVPVTHTVYGSHMFNVIGHDCDQAAMGVPGHTMTLQMDDQLAASMAFDAPEALVYAAQAISAGSTFHFAAPLINTVPAGNYQFTLENAVPAGGQIMLVKSGSSWNAVSYADAQSQTIIETASCTSGTDGTDLGSVDDEENPLKKPGIKAGEISDGTALVVNHINCTQYGYARWSQSAIRQWLNSAEAADEWWAPQNVFDRPPAYASNPGYLAGFDAAFVAALGKISHEVYLIGGDADTEAVTDRVFLLSREEVGFGAEGDAPVGSVYPYWDGASDTDRIRLRGASASAWWLRTPYRIAAGRMINSSGKNSYNNVSMANGLVPAFVIL